MNKLKELSKKKWFIVLVIVLAIALVGGLGTYAMFYWRSAENTEITLKIGDIADVKFPDGQELNTNSLAPVFNYSDGETLSFSIENKDTTGALINYTVNFNITNIDEQLRSTQLKYKLVSGNTILGEGDFSTATNNNTMKLAEGNLPSGTSNYTLYLYIDSNEENNPNMMNKNIRGIVEVSAYDPTKTLAGYIKALYLANKDANPVTNNGIEYGYASSVNLMNDRLGDATVGEDEGNVRYFGKITYFDEDDGQSDGEVEVGNWEALGGAPFTDSEGCIEYLNCKVHWQDYQMESEEACNEEISSLLEQNGFNTVGELCSTHTRYYKETKNYIDIGDKYTKDVKQGNWAKIYSAEMFADSADCLEKAPANGLTDETIKQYFSAYGFSGLDDFCEMKTVIEAGTPALWRIIGVFDGKVRIVRDESIGKLIFDSASNNWNIASLMKILNPGYENNQEIKSILNSDDNTYSDENVLVNNSLWWNNSAGSCSYGNQNRIENCDFTNVGLNNSVKSHLTNQTLYLGKYQSYGTSPNQALSFEKNGYNEDTVDTWVGKVGLIYPSDYAYAADFKNCNNRSTNEYNYCSDYNWMANNSNNYLTISPYNNTYNIYISNDYRVRYSSLYTKFDIRPTLLLSESVEKASGNGSKANPFKIK